MMGEGEEYKLQRGEGKGREHLLSYNLNITEVILVGHPGGLKGKEKRGNNSEFRYAQLSGCECYLLIQEGPENKQVC